MNSTPPLHGGNIKEEAQRIGVRTDQLLDASASMVPFPPPTSLQQCLINSLANNSLRNYPDCTHLQLRKAIGNWHQIDPDMVLPGNGASELFTWAAREAATKGLSGLPSPGFADYKRALRCWDASFTNLPLPLHWSSEIPQCFPLSPTTDTLWITNPHNPTGQLWSKQSIEPLLNNHAFVICDEAFLPLVPNGEKESLLTLVNHYPNLVVIRSLTKLFALAGLRLGYAIGAPDVLQKWKEWRDPWPLNSLAISAGIQIMENISELHSWIFKVQNWVQTEGSWMQSKLQNFRSLTPHPSSANFLLVQGESSLTKLREDLAQQRILLRDCRSFKALGERYLRVSLQTRDDNHRIIQALKTNLK